MNSLSANPWLVLGVAIVLEVCGTVCLKMSDGMTRLWPVLGVIVFYVSTFILMSVSMKALEVGTAYAVWAGLGTALITVAGIALFGESIAWTKLFGTGLIIAGVVLLHASTEEAPERPDEDGGHLHHVSDEGDTEQRGQQDSEL